MELTVATASDAPGATSETPALLDSAQQSSWFDSKRAGELEDRLGGGIDTAGFDAGDVGAVSTLPSLDEVNSELLPASQIVVWDGIQVTRYFHEAPDRPQSGSSSM